MANIKRLNPFAIEGAWYKAALHVHTTKSDGDVSLAERMDQYKRAGNQIMAVTDHWATHDVRSLSTDDFLVISGIEVHPPIAEGIEPYHLVFLNAPEGFEANKGLSVHKLIEKLRKAGGKFIFAHPYWSRHTINELLSVDGYIGVEIYNGASRDQGRAESTSQWEEVLEAGRIAGCVAVDDVEDSKTQFNLGWTMIKANELSADAVCSKP